MNRPIAATLLLLSSTLTLAAEPASSQQETVALAYNSSSSEIALNNRKAAPLQDVSQASTDRVLARTLDTVSASLSVELEQRIAGELPTVAR